MNKHIVTAQPWAEHGVRILERTTEGFFALDREWRFTYLSREAEQLLRTGRDNVLGEVIWSRIPSLLGSDFERALRHAGERQTACSVITYHPEHKSWYELRSYPSSDGMAVYVRDVTEQRTASAEHTRQIEQVDLQCRMYQTALSHTPDYHTVFDLQGRLLYANPPLLDVWKKTLDEVVGRTIAELGYAPELADRLNRQIQQVIDTRQEVHDETSYGSESEAREYEYVFVPVFGAGGEVEAVSGSSRDITERKAFEAAREQLVRQLRREQQRLNDIFNQAPCFMAVLRGPDHVIEMANARFHEHVGHRDLVGHKLREVFPEFEGQIFPELLDRVYETGLGYTGKETRVMLQRAPDLPPEPRYVDFVFQALRSADNVITGILVQGVDLTERKRAEEKLKAGEERYRQAAISAASAAEANAKFRAFFEQGAQFAGVLNLDGTLVEANHRCLEACGFGADDLTKKPFWECGWWDQSPELKKIVRDAVSEAAQGRVFRQETEYFTQGSIRTLDLVLAPVTSEDGRVLFVAATGIDITERKQAEVALRQSEARMRSIADSAPVLLWESDLKGLTFANQHFIEFFGRSLEELKGRGSLRFVHPEDVDDLLQLYKEAYAQRAQRVSHARLLRHDGQYRWVLTSAFPRFDEHGKFLGFVGSSSDITDLKHAEQFQRNIATELTRADRKKDEFLALLAHELRNPLAPLQSGIQMLDYAKDDSSALRRARDMMERQLRHMVRLIDDLLDISRVVTNKMELRRTRVALAEIVHTAVETADPVIKAAGHELAVSLPAEPVYLFADLTRMAQVVSNLLINSAKYTPQGGQISLNAVVRGEHVSIAVTDNGIGIPREALISVFHMFAQIDRSIERSTGGLGIGLALVKGLVELHGGTVSAHSPGANLGSTFTITLPVSTTGETKPATATPPRTTATVSKHRVLVVDDHRDAALGMAAVLKTRGHEVAVAHNGTSAIQNAESFRSEVILMDIGMPGLNGYDTTRKIRATEWGKAMFIIAVTGWGQELDRANSQAAGCNAHLVKPVNLNELEELLARAPTSSR